jgi:hypothetical protein
MSKVASQMMLAVAVVLAANVSGVRAQATPGAPSAPPASAPPISDQELEQLVAPIALYPDSLMTQILMASTYPLEVVEADRFAKANKDLKGDALTDQLEKQTWDPSIKSLVNFPTVLDMMSQQIDSTSKLGDAFIADQKRVLDAIQKLRAKAQAQGNLKTSEQQKVTVQQDSGSQVIVIEPSQPDIIYVPSYNPIVVYGAWPYPAYPPYVPPAYNPGAAFVSGAIGFGIGVACGAAWGYAWGHCNWGHGDVNVNVNQNTNFNRNINRNNYQQNINANNRLGSGGAGTWQHDPSHRQGVAYRDNNTAQRFGGPSANQAVQARNQFRGSADAGRQDLARGGADQFRGNAGANPGGGVQNRGSTGTGNLSGGGAGAANRGGPSSGGGGMQNRSGSSPGGGSSGGRSNAFGDVGSGNSARAASDRGAASRSSSFGGGGGSFGGSGGGGRSVGGGGGRSFGGGGGGRR